MNVQDLIDRWASKKLGATGMGVWAIKSLNLPPELAGKYLAWIVVAYLAVQGAVEIVEAFKKGGIKEVLADVGAVLAAPAAPPKEG